MSGSMRAVIITALSCCSLLFMHILNHRHGRNLREGVLFLSLGATIIGAFLAEVAIAFMHLTKLLWAEISTYIVCVAMVNVLLIYLYIVKGHPIISSKDKWR